MARIAELLGRPLMPWQRQVVDVALEIDPETGDWAYDDITVTVQRQAGKTVLLRPVIAHRCGMIDKARVFMTAQKRDKARARWMDATDDLLTSPLRDDLRRKVSNGHEELRWKSNHSTFVPFAPNAEDMHGETPDLVAVDELWAFDAEQAKVLQAAYVPGFTTKNGQAWKFSTAGTPASWWLNHSRAAGRRAVEAGVTRGVAYFEWSLPDEIGGVPVEELPDEQLVEACIAYHPATGHTLRPASVHSAWVSMGDRGEFLRAYGNRTSEDSATTWRAIDRDVWTAATSPRTIPGDAPVGLAYDVDPERRRSSVVAAWRGPDGRMLTETLRTDAGTRWVSGFVAGVVERNPVVAVGVFNAGPARDVTDELERAGVDVTVKVQQVQDYAAACARHVDELAGGSWLHRGDPELTAAASSVGWRRVNENRTWARGDEPITELVATTLAGWTFDHAPEPEKPLPRFWMG